MCTHTFLLLCVGSLNLGLLWRVSNSFQTFFLFLWSSLLSVEDVLSSSAISVCSTIA